MAEVEESSEADAVLDVVKAHVAAMLDITKTGYEKAQRLCDEGLVSIKKGSGLRSAVLDRALGALGVNVGGEDEAKNGESDDTPSPGADG